MVSGGNDVKENNITESRVSKSSVATLPSLTGQFLSEAEVTDH
jgi:hypothetical protein